MIHHAARSRKPIDLQEGGKNPLNRFGKQRLLALLLAVCLLLTAMPAYAASNSVTVYFTLSNDGIPVVGADGTILARHKVTVPYFDLSLYGLENFYRYETSGFGGYVNDTLVKKPTVLHLYIYMLERYYEGLPASQCGKGYLNMALSKTAYDRDGNVASQGQAALMITGSATSMYMYNFWGHDENLMYFVDHQYPLMDVGWGATADYILLESGMDVDVAMFTNWSFYNYGSFMYFEQDSYTFAAGETQTLAVLGGKTIGSVQGSFTNVAPEEGMNVYLWNSDMTEQIEEIGQTDADGCVDYVFEEAGTYLISAEDPNQGTRNAAHAPATAVVKVTENSVALMGISFEQAEYNLDYGNTWQLVPILNPTDATNVSMSWSSSNNDAVMVNNIGVLMGKGAGTSTITCTATDGKNTYSASCNVTVGEVVPVTGVSLARDSVTVGVGETVQLEYTVTPSNATAQAVSWRTSECPDFTMNYTDEDHTTAKVDHLGVVTGKKTGTVTVTVRTNYGGYTDTCTVTVTDGSSESKGDVNGDSSINATDARRILLYISGKVELTSEQLTAADVNGDGQVNATDARRILLFNTGKISELK